MGLIDLGSPRSSGRHHPDESEIKVRASPEEQGFNQTRDRRRCLMLELLVEIILGNIGAKGGRDLGFEFPAELIEEPSPCEARRIIL
jgi:hypothetical protein